MSNRPLQECFSQIRGLVASSSNRQTSDIELLRAFLTHEDHEAFAILVKRHGPMVLAVARRVLGNHHDAEDAFQAAFIHLAQNANSIRKHESVGCWLHGVVYRMATNVRRAVGRDLIGQSVPNAVRVRLEEAITYFENQKHRMDYPRYRARGWQIGSGPMESACKTVIGMRMKQGGMRWGTDGADKVGHTRALFRSEKGQWDAFWQRKYKNPNPLI
jgi:hypothetical protein